MKSMRHLLAITAAAGILSGCRGIHGVDMYSQSVDPYVPVNDEDVRLGECTIQLGDEVNVCGQGAWYKDCDIVISKGGVYTISGTYDSGCINVSTSDIVKLIFSDADISNPEGFAVKSSAERLIIESNGDTSITGSGGSYENAVYSDGVLMIVGVGDMCINGGVFSRGGIRFGGNVSTMCEIVRTEDGDIISGVLSVN